MFRGHSRAVLSVAALGLYTCLSIVIFGRDVVRDPANTIVGDNGADKTIFLWGLGWLPHAIVRIEDPLFTRALWAPHGTDLAWVTWTPGAALVAWPVSALAGLVPAYNALALAAPALAAWAAFLFLSELCRRQDVALLGGWVYGFSSFIVVHTTGHLHLTLCFLLPICALVSLRRFRVRLGRGWFVGLLATLLVAQLLLSTELAVTLVLFGATITVVAWTQLDPDRRERLRRTAAEACLAVAFAMVLAMPLLVHALVVAGVDAQPKRSAFSASTDVANLVVPTRRTLLRPPGSDRVVERFTAGGAERVGYLGIPLLISIVGLALTRGGRGAGGRTVLITLGIVVLASLGPRLRLAGITLLPGPWVVPAHLPVLEGLKPVRLMLYAALLSSVALCLWLADSPRSWTRWVIAVLAALALMPNPSSALWAATVPRPSFFARGSDREALPAGSTAIVLPYGARGWSMLWQAEGSFRYRLVGGHIGRRTTVDEEPWRDVYRALAGGGDVTIRRLRSFLRSHGVDAIVLAPGTPRRVEELVAALALECEAVKDTRVCRVRR